METGGDCAATSTAMFSTNESVARAELARLKAGNAVYAAWLATPQGQLFERNLGDSTTLKLFANLMSQLPLESAGASGGGTRDSDTSPPTPEPSGFGCLIRAGANPTTQEKLDALNCLVFATPHSFWLEHGADFRQLVDGPPYQLGEGLTIGPYNWFSYGGGDVCSTSPDGPISACRKHDVMWGSLKKFEGTDSASELDAAWNPRNKLLADAKLVADAKKYDCDDAEFLRDVPAEIFCALPASAMGSMMEYAIREFADRNPFVSPDWLYTQEDVQHALNNPVFVQCDGPHLADVAVTPERATEGFTFAVSWEFSDGCGQGISINKFSADIGVNFRSSCVLVPYSPLRALRPTVYRHENTRVYTSFEFPVSSLEESAFREMCDTASAVSKLRVRAWPNNVEWFSITFLYEFLATDIPTELEHGP